MFTPTTPRIVRKGVFTPRSRQPQYFEDVYGKRNYDDEFDRHVDECEDETDSDRDKRIASHSRKTAGRIFQRFAKQTGKPNKPTASSKAQSADHQAHNHTAKTSTNNTTSLTPTSTRKNLIPKKSGMFSSLYTTPTPTKMTSAAPSTDDFLVNGGLGDLDDDFPLLGQGEDAEDRAAHDAAVRQSFSAEMGGSTTETPNVGTEEATDRAAEACAQPDVGTKLQEHAGGGEEDDGYQADADEQQRNEEATAQPEKKKKRGRPAGTTKKQARAELQSAASRYETRGWSKKDLRSTSKIRPGGQDKATARSATMHRKAKKKLVKPTADSAGMAKRRSSRVVRKTGEKDGFVLIPDGDVDITEVEKHL